MDNKEFYKTDKPLSVRESFNNTILLLTMVKSEYYYITGFSRKNGIVEIAFDFESDLHGKLTELIMIDFYTDENNAVLTCDLKNIDGDNIGFFMNENPVKGFLFKNGRVVYEMKIPADKLIPTSINVMNKFILQAKSNICDFLERYYRQCVSVK